MVIKIGKLIFPPIRDIFILVLIDYNTLHLAHTERADEADNSESDTELNYERAALIWSLCLVNKLVTTDQVERVTRAPPPVQHLADTRRQIIKHSIIIITSLPAPNTFHKYVKTW